MREHRAYFFRSEDMLEKIEGLKGNIGALLAECKNTKELNEVRVKYLGKSGEITELLKGLKDVPKEKRADAGKLINELRVWAEEKIAEKEAFFRVKEREEQMQREKIDVTLPGKKIAEGSLHPITLVKNEIIEAFASMGFSVFDGPEVETDYYSFQALNIPKDHPARDMQDTFYINDNVLLRPHTSPGQIRCLEENKPPVKILSPGRVYRSDDDATHSPMFHQIEGLVVDEGITLCDLKGTLDKFAKTVFSKETETRLRPSYFPFTEPSVEVDVSCSACRGKGCRLCKGTGWIEVLGAGMINHRVLENCGLDSEKYGGFAFGLGIERVAMLKYGIPYMRMLFENDIRFLKQFKREV